MFPAAQKGRGGGVDVVRPVLTAVVPVVPAPQSKETNIVRVVSPGCECRAALLLGSAHLRPRGVVSVQARHVPRLLTTSQLYYTVSTTHILLLRPPGTASACTELYNIIQPIGILSYRRLCEAAQEEARSRKGVAAVRSALAGGGTELERGRTLLQYSTEPCVTTVQCSETQERRCPAHGGEPRRSAECGSAPADRICKFLPCSVNLKSRYILIVFGFTDPLLFDLLSVTLHSLQLLLSNLDYKLPRLRYLLCS